MFFISSGVIYFFSHFVSPKAAAAYAKKLGYSQQQFVRLCLQDLVDRDGLHLTIDVRIAA
jgi:hypothetical protein